MIQATNIEILERQKTIMAEAVASGWTIQDAGRMLRVDKNRAIKIWRRIRQDIGAQAV